MTETHSGTITGEGKKWDVASLNEQMTRGVVVTEFDESGVEGFVGRNETTTESEEQLSRPRSEVELRGGRFDACMTAGSSLSRREIEGQVIKAVEDHQIHCQRRFQQHLRR